MRGPRGGIILCKKEYAKLIDKGVFPGTQGGPLEHMIVAKAVAFKEAVTPEFKAYQNRLSKMPKYWQPLWKSGAFESFVVPTIT